MGRTRVRGDEGAQEKTGDREPMQRERRIADQRNGGGYDIDRLQKDQGQEKSLVFEKREGKDYADGEEQP